MLLVVEYSWNFVHTEHDLEPLLVPFQLKILVDANVPNMVGQISTILANAGLNIADLLNKSRGDVAYTIIDLDGGITDETLDAIRAIEGVLTLRHLPCNA